MSSLEPFPNQPTDNRPTKVRCVNLDWLEVHCREPITLQLNADYFRANGVLIEERAYGTRIYREMFTILGTDGQPYCEVRRNPASQGLNGIQKQDATVLYRGVLGFLKFFFGAGTFRILKPAA